MRRRYAIALGALSGALVALALSTIQLESAVYLQLLPYYQTSDFSERDQLEFQGLQQLSYALDDLGPWIFLAAMIPAIMILLIWMVSKRRVPQ